ncbi:MAG: hypothetical protein Q9160_005072 [Pyrenula sp. 1 TL-2023]
MCFREDAAVIFIDGTSIRRIKPCFEYEEHDNWTDALCEIDSDTVQAKMDREQCPHPGQFTGPTIPSRVGFGYTTLEEYDYIRPLEYERGPSKKRRRLPAGDVTINGRHGENDKELGGWKNENETGTKVKRRHIYDALFRYCAAASATFDGDDDEDMERAAEGLFLEDFKNDEKSSDDIDGKKIESRSATPSAIDSNASGDVEWAEGLFPGCFTAYELSDEEFDWAERGVNGMYISRQDED